MKVRYLHTMVRVKDLEKTMAFFELLGLKETRRIDNEGGRFSLIFMAAEGQEECPVELTYNWDGDDDLPIASAIFTRCARR
jgi:lactoylglutathione lyase